VSLLTQKMAIFKQYLPFTASYSLHHLHLTATQWNFVW